MIRYDSNSVKQVGAAGYAVQCTTAVKDSDTGNARMEDVYVVAVDRMVLAFDVDRFCPRTRTEIIKSSIGPDSILGCAAHSKVQTAGNGYQINLPRSVAESAGYLSERDGELRPVVTASFAGVGPALVIWPQGSKDGVVESTIGNLVSAVEEGDADPEPEKGDDVSPPESVNDFEYDDRGGEIMWLRGDYEYGDIGDGYEWYSGDYDYVRVYERGNTGDWRTGGDGIKVEPTKVESREHGIEVAVRAMEEDVPEGGDEQ